MKDYKVYWGDFHVNAVGYTTPANREANLQLVEDTFKKARGHVDFFPIAYYAFIKNFINGLTIESEGHDPSFDRHWEIIRDLVKRYNEPGKFITFMGYEWHGDRYTYGDHNVFYLDPDDAILTDAESVPDLYKILREHQGIAIPHHTAYKPGARSKDWRYMDEQLSPLVEIFSVHGSSEGCLTPVPMETNLSMGPRVQSTSVQEGLKKGYHFGIIASADTSAPMVGTWGVGLAAVCAESLTREGLWEAVKNRRTYGVTGDRIVLDYRLNNHFMGSIIEKPAKSARIKVNVSGSSAIDRIEVIKNGRVAHTYCHQGTWEENCPEGRIKFKHRFTVGWGPVNFGAYTKKWSGSYQIENGQILSVEPCFTTNNQSYAYEGDTCTFSLNSEHRRMTDFGMSRGNTQALVIEGEASPDDRILINIEGKQLVYDIRTLLEQSYIEPLIEESKKRIQEVFELGEAVNITEDVCYHNAYKVKIHRLIPEQGYKASFAWTDRNLSTEENYYYIRVSQANRQYAWSSPIWLKGAGPG